MNIIDGRTSKISNNAPLNSETMQKMLTQGGLILSIESQTGGKKFAWVKNSSFTSLWSRQNQYVKDPSKNVDQVKSLLADGYVGLIDKKRNEISFHQVDRVLSVISRRVALANYS